MSTKHFSFDSYLAGRLKDPEFRRLFAESPDHVRIAVEIARRRQRAHLTQAQLAERAGMQKQNITRLERAGYSGYTVRTLERVATALGTRVEIRFVDTRPKRGDGTKRRVMLEAELNAE